MNESPVGYRHPLTAWNGLTVTDLFCGAGWGAKRYHAAQEAQR